jgi:hypothetical protein
VRTVPCWSAAVPSSQRCDNPLNHPDGDEGQEEGGAKARAVAPPAPSNASHPMRVQLNGTLASVFLPASPPELLADGGAAAAGAGSMMAGGSRTWDQDALVDTIRSCSVNGSVSLSVMDYLPSSLYTPPQQRVWWPALNDALIASASAKGVRFFSVSFDDSSLLQGRVD